MLYVIFLLTCEAMIGSGFLKVLTSYAVLESCFRKEHSGFKRKGKIIKEKSPLHAIEWNRIIVSFEPRRRMRSYLT